ncbi:MAG: phenylalanine--tRNA ligase subunit beta, partial [Pyrinomonadaceae bacterium]
ISYNWLKDLVETKLAPRELAERLTMAGLAVEAVQEVGDDFVLEFDLTSNRPDCLSHLGIAREVGAIEGASVSVPEPEVARVEGQTGALTSVEILDASLCPRYAARVVRGVKIGPSPEWLVKRLEAIGQRPINNVADITNYVLHELGQPLHAFDLAKLQEQRIVVRRAKSGEKLKTLDGVERELDGEMLVIADAARPVALAGVMGGEDSEISNSTQDVLIESAYFNPASVRRTAKLLGMHTEASHRFERGVDYEGVLRAQERCVALICEIAGGTATEDAIDAYPQPLARTEVSLRPDRVEALTGLRVEIQETERILKSLGFNQAENTEERVLTFVVPTWRVDVEREEDLVEEVARLVGYEKILTALPPASGAGEYQPSERKKRGMRRALTAVGFDEAINFSFVDASHDERFELLPGFASTEAGEERYVTLRNSIIEGATRMRPTLLAGLLEAVRHNFNYGTRDVRLFEIGRVFLANKDGELPFERESFALVLTGGATEEGRAGAARELDFYDLKGALESAVEAMNIQPLRFEAASVKHLREGQAARILLDEETAVGTIGRLADEAAAEYKFRQPVYVCEVDLNSLLEVKEVAALYTPLPRYPSVVRDVSLLVNRGVPFGELILAVMNQKIEQCRSARLVGDAYEGANVPEGKRSLTLRMEYRADERTLRDEEVDEMHGRIVSALEEKFDAKMRQ